MSHKRTYADRRQYLIKAVAKRRRTIKEKAIKFLGGRCFFCGYSRSHAALDFHHIDEKSKSFGLSQDGLTRSWERTRKELKKCILVCANCHREIHVGLLQLSAEMLKRKSGEFREVPLRRDNPEPLPKIN